MKKIKALLRRKTVLAILLVLILLLAGLAGLFIYNQQKTKVSSTASGAREISGLISSVGKLIELPTDETPTLATVSDVTKLKSQAFFAKAENGDKVLIYTKNKKAILFRPSQNKIIEVAIYNTQESTSQTGTPTPTPASVKVVLYNGTTIVGYTKTIEAKIVAKHSNVEVVDRQNASSSSYKKTLIVDLGKNPEIAQALSSELSGQIGSLPSGETKPAGADILIILGSGE